MNPRAAKYWLLTVFGTIVLIWFWSLLGHFILPTPAPDFWLFIFVLSCCSSIAMFCIMMYYLHERQ